MRLHGAPFNINIPSTQCDCLHTDRSLRLYSVFRSNSKIIAESWLDEYKYLFYALKPSARQIPLNLRPPGSQPSYDPAQIKAELKCRPFDWLMRHVSPELRYAFPMQLMWEFN